MGIKIGEIARRSGVPPSTIRYYVRQGLLPEPDKVNKSMAYYDEGCIEKIQAIRYLQETRYFPLSVICNILRRMNDGLSLEEAESIEDAVFGTQGDLIEREGFLRATGLTGEELDQAEGMGLLLPYIQEPGRTRYNQEDIRFGKEILKAYLDLGGEFKDLDFYVTLGKEIMDHEQSLRKKMVRGKNKKENILITAGISKIADFLRGYILRRLFQRTVQESIVKSLDKDASPPR